jgi:RND family efflux transporter MFP subunit
MFRSLCVGLACFCPAVVRIALADPPPEVTVIQPVVRDVIDYGDFIGRAEAAQTVDIRPRVTGQLEKVCFKGGTVVQPGDLLFEIDSRQYRADLEKQMAGLQLAEARLKHLAVDLDRAQKLFASAAISHEELARVEAERTEAEPALRAARAGVEAAKLQLEFTKVVAPIGGKIGLPAVGAGNLVKSDATSLATIVSTDPAYVCFDIDEHTILLLWRKAKENREKDGDKTALPVACALSDETGYPRQGTLDAMDNHVDPVAGVLHARAVLPNSDGLIIPGMSVRVRLTLSAPHKAVLVPERAVQPGQGGKQAFAVVVTAAGVAERRPVKLGPMFDGLRVVKEGLAAGENIVAVGAQRLRPGMTVTVKKAESPGR